MTSDAISPNPYFAYGSNLSLEQMAQRCPGATVIGPAALEGFRFLINRRGVATIAADADRSVIGLLWAVTDIHLESLDGYEGVADGRYLKETRTTMSGGVGPSPVAVEAVVYRDPVVELGAPREGYLERVIEGAVENGLPTAYIDDVLRPAATAS